MCHSGPEFYEAPCIWPGTVALLECLWHPGKRDFQATGYEAPCVQVTTVTAERTTEVAVAALVIARAVGLCALAAIDAFVAAVHTNQHTACTEY